CWRRATSRAGPTASTPAARSASWWRRPEPRRSRRRRQRRADPGQPVAVLLPAAVVVEPPRREAGALRVLLAVGPPGPADAVVIEPGQDRIGGGGRARVALAHAD